MKPPPFHYVRAQSLDDALELLHERREEVDVLAGGQSLLPLLNLRQRRPEIVLDITRLPGLDGIGGGPDAITVGALVTQYDLGEHPDIDDMLRECLPYTGRYATRHRGTIGGSIAYGEPRGELPLTLLTLGGRICWNATPIPAAARSSSCCRATCVAAPVTGRSSMPLSESPGRPRESRPDPAGGRRTPR
jgi:CO/xanthine dehydrogenase FAD-binding subunit